MRGKLQAIAAIALGAITLASCSVAPPLPMPEPITLPIKAEPQFQATNYSVLAPSEKMTVRWTTADLTAQLKADFSALASDRASLVLVQEQLIVSSGTHYRRIWFSYGDEATRSMHGPCSQNIYLWFNSSGEVAGTYVEPQTCPI